MPRPIMYVGPRKQASQKGPPAMTDQTRTPAQARLEELLQAVNEARRAVEAEHAATARAAKAQRINARLQGQIDSLQQQINRLQERQKQLERRRVVTEPQAQEAPKARTKGARGGSRPQRTDGRPGYQTDRYLLHRDYQRIYKIREHT